MQVKLQMVDDLIHERDLEEMRKFYLLRKDDEYPCDCIFSGRYVVTYSIQKLQFIHVIQL